VVHATARCVRGRDELKTDFRNAFDAFSVEQNVSTEGLVVRGSWALEIADVETKLTPRTGGEHIEYFQFFGLIGKSVRFRPDFYTTRIMPPSDWTGTIVEERRSSSGQGN